MQTNDAIYKFYTTYYKHALQIFSKAFQVVFYLDAYVTRISSS